MIRRIGNIYGHTGGSYAGAVYDAEYLAPSLNTMEGGNRQPMITVVGSKCANAFRGHVDGYAPCIMAAAGEGGGMTPLVTDATIQETKTDNFMEQLRQNDNRPLLPEELRGKHFRIRKLTPRECFRLMDVTDEDIDKIQEAGISKSQQYRLAGNSIVVACMEYIFDNLFYPQPVENEQLTLFD